MFSTRLSFYHACQDLVSIANYIELTATHFFFNIIKMKIFDAQVRPIVLYGAEIWGLESCSSVIDNVHLFVWFETLFRCGQENPK